MELKPLGSRSFIRSRRHGRLSISHVRTWRASVRYARTVEFLTVGEVLSYWRQAAWTPMGPRRVYWQRERREAAAWAELRATLAARPAPEPPPGTVFGFANGTEYDMWICQNCDRCVKAGDPGERGSSSCDIFEAIHDAMDGCFPIEIAERMGYRTTAPHWGACPERETR